MLFAKNRVAVAVDEDIEQEVDDPPRVSGHTATGQFSVLRSQEFVQKFPCRGVLEIAHDGL